MSAEAREKGCGVEYCYVFAREPLPRFSGLTLVTLYFVGVTRKGGFFQVPFNTSGAGM